MPTNSIPLNKLIITNHDDDDKKKNSRRELSLPLTKSSKSNFIVKLMINAIANTFKLIIDFEFRRSRHRRRIFVLLCFGLMFCTLFSLASAKPSNHHINSELRARREKDYASSSSSSSLSSIGLSVAAAAVSRNNEDEEDKFYYEEINHNNNQNQNSYNKNMPKQDLVFEDQQSVIGSGGGVDSTQSSQSLFDSSNSNLKQQQLIYHKSDLNSKIKSPISIQQTASSSDKNIENVTVKVGQQAVLPCFVNNLGPFKVIWAKNGDILALGSNKINSDARLNVQHRYVSEWHLIIDNVVTDDEGEYICKTNGNFFKTIYLQVLMPPTIDDMNSTPAGTITLKEDSSITLRCYADGKPEPVIKWYRWKKYKHLISEKEELNVVGNEITINGIKRNDANIYECIAKNSVPPATSRIFNIEIHFLPSVELEIRKTFQFLHKKFSLECKINGNPLERVYWYKDGAILTSQPQQQQQLVNENIRVDQYDISNINDYFKTLLTLTVSNANKEDFGEYQCCATNQYGQICSNIIVQEIKPDIIKPTKHHQSISPITVSRLIAETTTTESTNPLALLKQEEYQQQEEETNKKLTKMEPQTMESSDKDIPNIINDDNLPLNENSDESSASSSSSMSNSLDEASDSATSSSSSLSDGISNSLDSKDKRRHFLIKSKQFLHLESQPANESIRIKSINFQLVIAFQSLFILIKYYF